MKTKTMTTLHLRNSISPKCFRGSLLTVLLLALCCFALPPTARAQLPAPTPDGGYPNNNTAEGTNALFNLTTGTANTAVGYSALLNNTTGSYNVGIGSRALYLNKTNNFNMAIGTEALYSNTADSNLAIGFQVLYFNTTGNNLTGIGAGALLNNTTGAFNTAVGAAALHGNLMGQNNTAVGRQALYSNTTIGSASGSDNTATGSQALYSNLTGSFNTANGQGALFSNSGSGNTANGQEALGNNMTGNRNTANGVNALRNNTLGSGNTALGASAGFNLDTGSGNICIGSDVFGMAGESGTIRIGKDANQTTTYIGGIDNSNFLGASDQVVWIDTSNSRLHINSSSRRFKHEIKPMDKASEALFALKPVRFHYNEESKGAPQSFGLIAEDVEKVNRDLVVRDADGAPFSVRYEQINAMLLNEFLKEHKKVEQLEGTVATLVATVKEQASQIQKVSAQLELNKPAPRTVLNNP